LVNRLLAGRLDERAPPERRASACQGTEIARKQHGGRLPKSFKGKVRFNPDGTFGVTAQVGTGSGLYEMC
jgi:hypothetical protein